ncbi:hypothetical protein HC725_07095 [Vibrio sp. S17_S38]|uniref:response regulator receiver domain n=1 Tax=Vibrio sp. S17_S38 TaxID=2720229 RepID=UPI0016801830|nr:response regulator receiver domain [Vibrio sp. S17_S38]MBD1573043.1 hypothetical protein [Vibrio sp. S17_S38]
MTNTVETYQDLIKEAFISPIRTVTVIDDEYPTLQELLQSSGDKKVIANTNNIERLIRISNMCHHTHGWSLDVFDGKAPKIGENNNIPEHLNHSDLLILDYHLDGEPPSDDGSRARRIINELDSNSHFNIILVHTKGVSEDIREVYEEILFDLYPLKKPDYLEVHDTITEKIDVWLDNNNDGEDYSWLTDSYKKTDILKLIDRVELNDFKTIRNPKHLFNSKADEITDISKEMDITQDELVKWRVLELCEKSGLDFSGESKNDLKWLWEDSGNNYISTGKVFISVIRKVSNEPESELFEALSNSLNSLNASPMHLLMAKIRHEIDERGLEQALNIISNRPAQAGWLYNLLSQSTDTFAHDKAIDLHWEQLGRASKQSLRDFSQRLVSSLKNNNQDNKKVVKQFFNDCMGQLEQSCGYLNAFTCSMPVVGSHLNTGTVLLIDDDYWVCLTPACDLVPNQKLSHWEDRIGKDHLTFKAVKLNPVKLTTANGKANNNEFLYLTSECGSELKVFEFSNGESPIWDTFYASNQGRFSPEKNIELSCVRFSEEGLDISASEAKVVSELRYEYALNLLQRLGSNQTRVGLDFIEKSRLW